MQEFVKTEKNGTLYIDKILFESNYPILFSCKNVKNDTFIVICCQNNEKGIKWLVGKTTPLAIVRMLRDEITIRQLITAYSTDKFSIDYKDEKLTCNYDLHEWLPVSIYLPKEDSYIMAEPGEFDEEIEYFTQIGSKMNYASPSEYSPVINKIEHVESNSAISIDEFISLDLLSDCGKPITGEIIRTVQTPWEQQPEVLSNSSDYDVCKEENVNSLRYINISFESVVDNCFTHEDFEKVNIELKKVSKYNLPNAA